MDSIWIVEKKRHIDTLRWENTPKSRYTQISVYGKNEHNQIDLRSGAADAAAPIQTRACRMS